MPGHQGEAEAERNRSDRCSDGPVHPAWRASIYSFRQRPRVRCSGREGPDRRCWCRDCQHQAGIILGERILRKLQCTRQGRTAERRNLLLALRSSNHHRKFKETLQHQASTQRTALPPTGPGNHHPDGAKADHALTIAPDHSSRADHP